MKAYSIFICNICCIYKYTSIEIKPELKKNILKFGYGINCKYEGMLAHSFNRFYVVMKFILPTANGIYFSKLKFDDDSEYLRKSDKGYNHRIEQHISDLIVYCRKMKPYVYFYKQQIKSLNDTGHDMLKNELDIIFQNFWKIEKEREVSLQTLISGFMGLAYEGISSFLHNRRHKALHKEVKVINNQTTI